MFELIQAWTKIGIVRSGRVVISVPGDEVPKIDKFRFLLSSGSFVGVCASP
jgi:hypothetical protein